MYYSGGFPGGSVVKKIHLPMKRDAEHVNYTPGLGRPPGEGNGDPFQYSCLENSMNRGAQGVTVHGITMSDLTEKVCITHAQILSQLLHATLYP